jgi:hypothetical protein
VVAVAVVVPGEERRRLLSRVEPIHLQGTSTQLRVDLIVDRGYCTILKDFKESARCQLAVLHKEDAKLLN